MDWLTLAQLIIAVGLPAAEKIWSKWAAGQPPAPADWDELRLASSQVGKDRMLLALQAAGIDPNSPQGKTFIALTLSPTVPAPAS